MSRINLIIILSLVFQFSSFSARATTLDRLEASVNSSIILLSDVNHFRKTFKLRAQLDPLFSGTAVASHGDSATNQEIVDFLIDEKLMTQAYSITDNEVEQEINSIQANNHLDREHLKNLLSEQGFKFEDYFDLIRISAAKRALIDRDIRTKVTISDDDVKNYFYNHFARKSSTPLIYKLQIISVAIKNYKTPSAARDVAQRASDSLKGGEAFEEVAKRMSDDSTAQAGGELGELTDDQMSPAIREEAKKIQIGQTSPVFGGPQAGAFLIIKLNDVKSGENDRLEKQKEEIRNQMIASEYQHQIVLWLERQRQTAFIHKAGEPAISTLKSK